MHSERGVLTHRQENEGRAGGPAGSGNCARKHETLSRLLLPRYPSLSFYCIHPPLCDMHVCVAGMWWWARQGSTAFARVRVDSEGQLLSPSSAPPRQHAGGSSMHHSFPLLRTSTASMSKAKLPAARLPLLCWVHMYVHFGWV